jgi:hypothetical protein
LTPPASTTEQQQSTAPTQTPEFIPAVTATPQPNAGCIPEEIFYAVIAGFAVLIAALSAVVVVLLRRK